MKYIGKNGIVRILNFLFLYPFPWDQVSLIAWQAKL